jgi:hypothetical protein
MYSTQQGWSCRDWSVTGDDLKPPGRDPIDNVCGSKRTWTGFWKLDALMRPCQGSGRDIKETQAFPFIFNEHEHEHDHDHDKEECALCKLEVQHRHTKSPL